MDSRTHVEILGVQIPLRTLASVTSTPIVYATLGEYKTYYSVSSPDIAKAIKAFEASEYKAMKCLFNPNPPFTIPRPEGISRQLFTYSV